MEVGEHLGHQQSRVSDFGVVVACVVLQRLDLAAAADRLPETAAPGVYLLVVRVVVEEHDASGPEVLDEDVAVEAGRVGAGRRGQSGAVLICPAQSLRRP